MAESVRLQRCSVCIDGFNLHRGLKALPDDPDALLRQDTHLHALESERIRFGEVRGAVARVAAPAAGLGIPQVQVGRRPEVLVTVDSMMSSVRGGSR